MSKKITTLTTSVDKGVCTVSLCRPEVRNAFNDVVVRELASVFEDIKTDPKIRVVVLRGEGSVFCAGGDLNWMKSGIGLGAEANLADTRQLAQTFKALNECPKPVVGLVQKAAIGGGVGLVSVCDYVIATVDTTFSLSEVRLGVIPACIGPFVLAKIGESHCRAYFMSAQRFDAARALDIGLIHEVVESEAALQKAGQRVVENLCQAGPNALKAAKELIRGIKSRNFEDSLEFVAKMLADIRVTPEGLEGVKAFLEKRKPNWISE